MMLEILQCLVFLLSPLELVVELEQFEEGNPLSPSREMNRFKATMQPVSFLTSLIVFGGSMAMMTLIFSEFSSIAQ
jgi:hypothetical protein